MKVIPEGKKLDLTDYQKKKQKEEYNERNQIEGKFGQAKQAYDLNNIKDKLSNTPHSWIRVILFYNKSCKTCRNL